MAEHFRLRFPPDSNIIPNQDEAATTRAAHLGWAKERGRTEGQGALAPRLAQEAAGARREIPAARGPADAARRSGAAQAGGDGGTPAGAARGRAARKLPLGALLGAGQPSAPRRR